KLGESGFRLWAEAWEGATEVGRSVVYLGINLSPALLAVGFIIGLNTASVVFLGGALGWLVLMPVYAASISLPAGLTGLAAAQFVWRTQLRFIVIGSVLN